MLVTYACQIKTDNPRFRRHLDSDRKEERTTGATYVDVDFFLLLAPPYFFLSFSCSFFLFLTGEETRRIYVYESVEVNY